MKRNCGIGQIIFKRYVRRGDVDPLEVETRMVLQAIQDGSLYFFLRFQVVTAGGKDREGKSGKLIKAGTPFDYNHPGCADLHQ